VLKLLTSAVTLTCPNSGSVRATEWIFLPNCSPRNVPWDHLVPNIKKKFFRVFPGSKLIPPDVHHCKGLFHSGFFSQKKTIQFSGNKRNPLSLHRAENKSSGPIFSLFFFGQFFASMAKQKPPFDPSKETK